MQLRYDDDFLESAIFLCATGRRAGIPGLQVPRFHHQREKLYSVLDPEGRNAAFFNLHLEWFREWGLEKLLNGFVSEFQLLPPALNVLAWRRARTRSDEGAELYVSAETGRNAVVALRAERFTQDEGIACFLRHEFMHLSDMVDPGFGYSPELPLRGAVPAPQRVVSDRYRLLWDITIDGRLSRAGREVQTAREWHEALFDRAYSFWSGEKRRAAFDELWNSVVPRHARLLQFASDPHRLEHACGPVPGSACPLCGFSTFDWADISALEDRSRDVIANQFLHWTPAQGACSRCVEMYEALGKGEIPPTMCV